MIYTRNKKYDWQSEEDMIDAIATRLASKIPETACMSFQDFKQDLILQALKAKKSFDPTRSAYPTFIFKCMKNQFLHIKERNQKYLTDISTDKETIAWWEDFSILDMFSPHNDDDAWKMKEVFDEIKDSVNSLDAETKRVIIERYYEDKTLDKIGKEIGKSRERVRQIENRWLKYLRTNQKIVYGK